MPFVKLYFKQALTAYEEEVGENVAGGPCVQLLPQHEHRVWTEPISAASSGRHLTSSAWHLPAMHSSSLSTDLLCLFAVSSPISQLGSHQALSWDQNLDYKWGQSDKANLERSHWLLNEVVPEHPHLHKSPSLHLLGAHSQLKWMFLMPSVGFGTTQEFVPYPV